MNETQLRAILRIGGFLRLLSSGILPENWREQAAAAEEDLAEILIESGATPPSPEERCER